MLRTFGKVLKYPLHLFASTCAAKVSDLSCRGSFSPWRQEIKWERQQAFNANGVVVWNMVVIVLQHEVACIEDDAIQLADCEQYF
jgi:hypothetical protein